VIVLSAAAATTGTPLSFAVTGTTATSIATGWQPPTGTAPAGYSVYRNSVKLASTQQTRYTFSGLVCGTSYTLAVDSYDASQSHSAPATLTAATSPCAGDTTPPSIPTGLAVTSVTPTSITLSWSPSTDNVGVAGYRVYVDGNLAGTTTTTGYVAAGLTCGTTHAFTVAAYDAAGNASAASAPVSGQTGACSSGPVAQVWVDTSGGTCTRQLTPLAYGALADAAACPSLRAAFNAASSGDSIGVEAGSYGASQTTISYRSSITSTVTFFPDGGTVTFAAPLCFGNDSSTRCDGVISDAPSWVTLDATAGSGTFVYKQGLDEYYRSRQGTHITVVGGHSAAGSVFYSPDTLTLRNLEIGPSCCSADGLRIGWGNVGRPIDHNVTLDGLYIHDIARRCAAYPGQSTDGIGPSTCPGDTTAHVDCVQFMGGDTLTITRNSLYNCATQGLFLGGSATSGAPAGTTCVDTSVGCYAGTILIQNNMLGAPYEAGRSLVIGRGTTTADPSFAPGSDVELQYNSVANSVEYVLSAYPPSEVDYIANIGTWPSWVPCNQLPAVTYVFADNVFTGRTCSTTDYLESALTNDFINTGTLAPDLYLKPTAPAINRGDPNLYPPTDLANTPRPLGGLPDAGADEAG
jgi:chitodextrinase